jgi:hypothetical protein
MSDQWEIEVPKGFAKNPWIGVPAVKRQRDCHVDEWFSGERTDNRLYFYELGRRSSAPIAVLIDEADESLNRIFTNLVSEWKEETWSVSSVKKRILHPAFLKIIGLGAPAVPLILEELRREPDYWSYALEAITREDPAPYAENLQQLRDAWLAWGQAHGY